MAPSTTPDSNPDPDPDPSSAQDDAAYDAFLDAVESGEAPALDAFLARWPGVSDGLRTRLRTLSSKLRSGSQRFESIGGMLVTGTLGRGGMGEVLSAYDAALDRHVAVKVLLSPLAHQPGRIERLRAEARILASLDHPGVAVVYGLGLETEAGEPLHIVMELIRGQDLARILRARGALPFPEALSVLTQIASALSAAHERGILHRDLKPSNVMLRPDGAVKVLDFGLSSRSSAEGTSSPRGAGTPGYMSPEQIRGERQDARSDVWAFGQLAAELVNGERPVDGVSLADGAPSAFVDLVERCLRDDPVERPADGQALSDALATIGDLATAGTSGPDPLPSSRGTLFGRSALLERLQGELRKPGLLTLVGPAGVGKTRLALEALRQRGGAHFAELSAATPETTLDVIGRALGSADGSWLEKEADTLPEVISSFARRLENRRAPVLLDNCEHVVGTVRRAVQEWTALDSELLVVCTSREPIGLPGELVVRVEPLETREAARLFVERARGAGSPEFPAGSDSGHDVPAVLALAARLDGLPLAIELSAARAAAVGVEAVMRGIEGGSKTDGSTGAQSRHGSLDAAIRWSFELLDPPEKRLLQRLSTFRRGFTVADAERLIQEIEPVEAGAVLEGLASLTRRSLLTRQAAGQPGSFGRWRLLQTVRHFAEARLREEPRELTRAESAHMSVQLALGREAASMSFGERRRSTFDAFEAALDDFTLACSRARQQPSEAARFAIVVAELFEFWLSRGRLGLGDRWLRTLLSSAGVMDPIDLAQAHLTLGTIAHRRGHSVAAGLELQEALRQARASGDEAMIARVVRNQACHDMEAGQMVQAEAGFERALEMEMNLGNFLRVGALHNDIGLLRRQQGRLEEAASAYERGHRLRREAGCAWGIASSLGNLGEIHHRLGSHAQARMFLERSFEAFQRLGDVRSIAESLELSAALETSSGNFGRAAQLLGAATGLRQRIDFPKPPGEAAALDDLHRALENEMGSEALYGALREGEAQALADVLGRA